MLPGVLRVGEKQSPPKAGLAHFGGILAVSKSAVVDLDAASVATITAFSTGRVVFVLCAVMLVFAFSALPGAPPRQEGDRELEVEGGVVVVEQGGEGGP